MSDRDQTHVFVAGICGTFMAGLALLARARGMQVSGCDANVYPPMSDQLRAAGIAVQEGYEPRHLDARPDVVVIGNALSRGNRLVEHVLDSGLAYTSGPQWLWENVLHDRHVIAVAGTHGKTTSASLVAWILHEAGLEPGFLIGGIPVGFGMSARLGGSRYFVIEADEYDTAFFDKRSKFVHYRPRTLVINNIEYDHADIFPDLAAIQRQFHHLLRTVPSSGTVIHPRAEASVDEVLSMGCWSGTVSVAVDGDDSDLCVRMESADGTRLRLEDRRNGMAWPLEWSLRGRHNAANAAAAAAAALAVGVPGVRIVDALSRFDGVKRRLEVIGTVGSVTVYDDFAHHPTAIATTLEGLRAGGSAGRLVAVIEPRSNTMRLGAHRASLPQSVASADRVYWYQPAGVDWDIDTVAAACARPASVHASTEEIIRALVDDRLPGDRIVVMSNGGFEGIHLRIVRALREAGGG